MRHATLEHAVFEGEGLADPVKFVAETGNFDELFSDRQGEYIGLLHFMIASKSREALEILLDLGANIELMTSYRSTPLAVAVLMNNEDLATLLVGRGANPNAQDAKGDTPLIIAITNENQRIAQYLLDHGADLDTSNNTGISARLLMHHTKMSLRIPNKFTE